MIAKRLIFAGTPDFAVPSLKALLEAGYDIAAVYTQPDRPAKRGQQLQMSAIKQFALAQGLPVYQPTSLRTPEAQAQLAAFDVDAFIVVAYGLLLPEAVLALPKVGCINVHGSLLPRWRGAAPIQRALAAGDSETGVTIMQMEKGLDTGGIYLKKSQPLSPMDTSASLFTRLSVLGATALIEALPAILAGTLLPTAQDHALSTHAAKLTKLEAELDFSLPAATLVRQINAFNPWPVATLTLEQQTLKIWHASAIDNPEPTAAPGTWLRLNEHGLLISCSEGALLISQVQLANQKSQAVSAIYRQGKLAELFAAAHHAIH